jgi:hypothetical protein
MSSSPNAGESIFSTVRDAYDASCVLMQPNLFSQYLPGDGEVLVFVMREQALTE